MKQFLLSAFLLLTTVFTSAQNLISSLSWGNVYKSNTFLHKVLGSDEQHVYLLHEKYLPIFKELSEEYILQKVDLDGNFIENIDLILPDKDKLVDAIMINGNIYLYSARKNGNTQYISVNRFDKNSKTIVDNDELLISFDFNNAGVWYNTTHETFASQNKEHFLFYYKLPGEKDAKERFALAKFDKDFKLEWRREVELPCLRKKFWTHNFVVNNDGSIHLVAVIFNDKDARHKDDDQNYDYHLINIDETETEIIPLNVKVRDMSVIKTHLSVIDGDELTSMCYFTKTSKTKMDGVFVIKINTLTGELINKNTISFDRYFKESLNPNKKSQDFILNDLTPRNIILHKDGSVSFVGERYFSYLTVTTTETRDKNTNRTKTSQSERMTFVNGSIVVVRINDDLSHKWTKTIYKRQSSKLTDNYHGFLLYEDDNDLRILFNDDVKNNHSEIVELSELKIYNSLKKNRQIVEAIVDQNGVISYNALHVGGPYKLIMTENKRSPILEKGDYLLASKLNQGYKRKKRQIGIYKF